MNTKIDPATLRRIEILRAPHRARLRKIIEALGSDPDNLELLIEVERIRLTYLEIMHYCEGGQS